MELKALLLYNIPPPFLNMLILNGIERLLPVSGKLMRPRVR